MLGCFEFLASLYRVRFLEPALQEHVAVEDDWRSALAFFLGSYAFERQVRSPDYAPAAVDAVRSVAELTPASVWAEFARSLGDRKLNHACNPLCPQGTSYLRSGEQRRTRQPSIVESVLEDTPPRNLAVWAREGLRKGETAAVHGAFCGVAGISTKIASFFLRDVATMFQLEVAADRHLLQPVDLWVGRCARLSFGDSGLQRPEDCAKAIVERCAKAALCPEHVNQGMWYFATELCKSSEYVLGRTLMQPAVGDAIDSHVRALNDMGCRAAEEWDAWEWRSRGTDPSRGPEACAQGRKA